MIFTETLIIHWDVILSFFAIAIIYASVGFGGGSSYLAILALAATFNYTEIRSTSLLCNIVVVSNSFYIYYKKGYYNFSKVTPLVITSIPLAFLGGYLKINETLFFLLLGGILLTASIIMFSTRNESIVVHSNKTKKNQIAKGLGYGGSIGFLSGMVGIGGGIFLAPLLHLTKWDNSKRIAATASLFILVNSIAGLGGQMLNPDFSINTNLTLLLVFTTFIGGQIGTRISIKHIKPLVLKKTTAVLIAFVAIKILLKYF
jgi:uncharacterized membrane protein YfcA